MDEPKKKRGGEASARWRERHPERAREVQARWRERHPNHVKDWRKKNSDHVREYTRQYYQKNKKRIYANSKKRRLSHLAESKAIERAKRLEIKLAVFDHYGGRKCACCGDAHLDFLTLDHMNNNGNQHRRELGGGGKIMRHLKANGYPDGYQVLCFNCNYSRYLHNGKCIHQMEAE